MAELDIGKHCSVQTCKILDFLPFTCPGCGLVFCKNHEKPDKHDCSECNITRDGVELRGPKSYRCALDECDNKELTQVLCPACSKSFCLRHRHQIDHQCDKYEEPQPKMTQTARHVQEILERRIDKPTSKLTTGRKSKSTAAKVALMKIKMKALGDKGIPDTERVYLSVVLPSGCAEKSKPCFFSMKWSIGRVIDAIASLAKLQNSNNLTTAKKLRLFDHQTGNLYPVESYLESLMGEGEEQICNGGSVILEYVPDDVQKLTDLQKYS